MTRDDDRLSRLKQQRSKEAIDLAMKGRWQDAVAANMEILESFPGDVESHNRLGRAYMELGDFTRAREFYGKAVELDPYNAIANRNLRRLRDVKELTLTGVDNEEVEPHQFIEEIGKAGVVPLYDLSPKEIRARMVNGDKIDLRIETSALVAYNGRGEYMGKVDARTAQRLLRLTQGGNRYSAAVVRSMMDEMTIMIREVYQDPSQVGKLSFPPKGLEEVRPYASDRVPDAEGDGEEDDSGYTIIGGDEIEVLPDESMGNDDEVDADED